MKNKIKVCPSCGIPLVWTFCFAYNEYFCVNCHYKQGMFGQANDLQATAELQLEQNIVEAVWKQLYGKGWLLPKGSYGMRKCKKCAGTSLNHNEHLTKREKERNEEAWKMLERLRNFLLPKSTKG